MSDFCSSLWPEEATPDHLAHCGECGLDKHGSRMVWGEGNPNASIMVLLDNPGSREDRENRSFVCGTRQTLQRAVVEVGLDVNDLYVTYVLKRKPVRSYDKERTRQICLQHLEQQLEVKTPKYIVLLGNVAVQSFYRNEDLDVKSLRGQLHIVKGYQTFAAYHPLAVRRRPNLWPLFLEDWKLIAEEYFRSKDRC